HSQGQPFQRDKGRVFWSFRRVPGPLPRVFAENPQKTQETATLKGLLSRVREVMPWYALRDDPMFCISLVELFGDRYRVTLDRQSGEGPRDNRPWLQEIRCRRGLIYPYSATHLAVQVDYHRCVAQRLVRMGFQLIQDGDREKTFVFTIDRLDEVAVIVEP